jgi:Phage tail tube protein
VLIKGADPTIAVLTGRIDVRFADTTLIDLAADGTPVDLEFAYTLSVQAKLVLTAHVVYLPKPKLAVEGLGGVQASFDFRGAKNDVAGACSRSHLEKMRRDLLEIGGRIEVGG